MQWRAMLWACQLLVRYSATNGRAAPVSGVVKSGSPITSGVGVFAKYVEQSEMKIIPGKAAFANSAEESETASIKLWDANVLFAVKNFTPFQKGAALLAAS